MIGDLIKRLITAGCDPTVAGDVVGEAFELGVSTGHPPDKAMERRRAWDRERKRKERSRPPESPPDPVDSSLSFFSPLTEEVCTKEERKKERACPPDSGGQQFDEFWEVYPNKVGKPAARRAFLVAIRKVSLADLIVGVRRYMVHKPADRPWLNPATFLNQERWADQPAPVAAKVNGNGKLCGSAAIERLQQRLEESEVDFSPGEDGWRRLSER